METRMLIHPDGSCDLVLTPETAGEQRMIDYLVMSKPLREARDFDDTHGEIEFQVKHSGHMDHGRVEELRLVRRPPAQDVKA